MKLAEKLVYLRKEKRITQLVLIVVLCVCSGLLIFNMYQNKLAEERRCESLISGAWIGSNRSASIEFCPDGSVNVDRTNSEMVGKAIITNSSGSVVEGYYRTYHHCTRIFVFDNQDFRLGTFIFDGKTLKSEGSYTQGDGSSVSDCNPRKRTVPLCPSCPYTAKEAIS